MDQREMLRYAESKTAANSRGFTPATTRQLGRSESPGVPRICPDRSGASGGIHALEWVPRVPEADRLAYEEAARQAGFPSFHFREASHYKGTVPVGQRNEHFPVYYVEPYVGNEAAKGFDLGTDRTRAVALHRARDTGKPVATARITLVQDHSDHYGFLIFLPVYHNKIPHDSLEAHRQDLNGFALGVFRVADFVEAALHNLDRVGIALLIMDVTTSPDQSLLYDSARQVQGAAALASEVPKAVKPLGLQWQTTLDFAERRWEITFVPSLAYLSAHQTW
jgi:CHASE1-domain containing sensor protein